MKFPALEERGWLHRPSRLKESMTGNGTPYFGKRVIADLKVEKESASQRLVKKPSKVLCFPFCARLILMP
jgi:hypothetical protein